MHPGSIHRDTAAGRVYRLLAQCEGRWLSGKEINDLAMTTCCSTQICGVRQQLPPGEFIDYERRGKHGHFYRLVRRGQMELAV